MNTIKPNEPNQQPAWYPVTVANPYRDNPDKLNFELLSEEVIAAFPGALGFNRTGTDPDTLAFATLTIYLEKPQEGDEKKLEAVIAAHKVKDDAGNPILSKGQQKKTEADAARATITAYAANKDATLKDTQDALAAALRLLGLTNGS